MRLEDKTALDRVNVSPSIIQEWINLLRSGTINQHIGAFSCVDDDDNWSYCAMGVLGIIGKRKMYGPEYNCRIDGSYAESILASVIGTEFANELSASVVTMNDSDGLSFEQIADWLDQTL